MKSINIAVLESRWWEGKNTSVRGMFDLLSDLYCDNHHAYHYEMCNSGAALKEALSRYVNKDEDTHYISIASHGSETGLSLYNKDSISRAEIRNILKRDSSNRAVAGIHFGSCLFGTEELAIFLHAEDISPWWIAGYGATVDFVKSTMLDLLFFQELLNHKRKDPVRQIHEVSQSLIETVPGLIKALDFGVYFYDDDSREVVDLLACD